MLLPLQLPLSQPLPPQLWHAFPPVPHATSVSPVRQMFPEQQPLQLAVVHFAADPMQFWPLQLLPAGQAMHGRPPVPQASLDLPSRQVLPAQHPLQLEGEQLSATASPTLLALSAITVSSPHAPTTQSNSSEATTAAAARPPAADWRRPGSHGISVISSSRCTELTPYPADGS